MGHFGLGFIGGAAPPVGPVDLAGEHWTINIQDAETKPLLTLSFVSEIDAKAAQLLLSEALSKVSKMVAHEGMRS